MAKPLNIADSEISLIKAMIGHGMPLKDIQFFFNRRDRPVNSGRISEIKNGQRATAIAAASKTELDAFLAAHSSPVPLSMEADIPPSPIAESTVRSLFRRSKSGEWRLVSAEGWECEAKAGFWLSPLEKFAPALRAIGAFANNAGGYIFFGVEDETLRVKGLPDNRFAETDPAAFSQAISGSFDPCPHYETNHIEFDGLLVGVIYVHPSSNKPVISTKNLPKLAEGSVFYRYPGESKAIKPGELRKIIADREHAAVRAFADTMAKTAVGDAAILDLDSGLVEGARGKFVIGEELLPKIQFIREGEFLERSGAPALKLVGDVILDGQQTNARVVRQNVTDEATLINFLRREKVESPMQYLLHSCHTQKQWLPMFFYVSSAGITAPQAAGVLKEEAATHPNSQRKALSRLSGSSNAFTKPIGTPQARLISQIRGGEASPPTNLDEAMDIARAIQSLPDGEVVFGYIAKLLLEAHKFSQGLGSKYGNLRSAIYKAACRLDELAYKDATGAT